MAAPQLRLNVAPGNQKTATKENNNKRLFRGKLQTLVRSFFYCCFGHLVRSCHSKERREKKLHVRSGQRADQLQRGSHRAALAGGGQGR